MDKLKVLIFFIIAATKLKQNNFSRFHFFKVETRTLGLYIRVRFKRQKILGSKKYLVTTLKNKF